MKQVVITIEDDEEIKWVDGVLTKIKKNDEPKSIMDRVKSYEDACGVLHESPIDEYEYPKHVVALLKLETIIKALNEGWEATDHMDEEWWYSWFFRFDEKYEDEYKKSSYVYARCYSKLVTDKFIAFACTTYDKSHISSCGNSRLALKSKELAEYCGKQFIQLWANYLLG